MTGIKLGWAKFDHTVGIYERNSWAATANRQRERFTFKDSSLAMFEHRCRSESVPPADWKQASFQPPSMRWHKGAAMIRTLDTMWFSEALVFQFFFFCV